jgi:uncharacterized protein (DUF433 family)
MPHILTDYKYIELDDNGIASITDTTLKVTELITSHLTYGWSPEELHFQYPHITLSQIYSALAYYWDKQETLDAEIKYRLEQVEALCRTAPPSRIAQKLRERGVIS